MVEVDLHWDKFELNYNENNTKSAIFICRNSKQVSTVSKVGHKVRRIIYDHSFLEISEYKFKFKLKFQDLHFYQKISRNL